MDSVSVLDNNPGGHRDDCPEPPVQFSKAFPENRGDIL